MRTRAGHINVPSAAGILIILLLLSGCGGGDRLARVDPLTLPPDLQPGVDNDEVVTGERRTATLSDFSLVGGDGRIAEPVADVTIAMGADGDPVLHLPYPFLDAWRRMNLSIDRAGFSVEERDRSERRFLVRYDPASASEAEQRRRGLARLAFWRAGADDGQPRLLAVRLSSDGRETRVQIGAEDGSAIDPDLAHQLLDLIKMYLV